MTSVKTFYPKNRKQWRNWLQKNFETKKEIWLVFPLMATNKPRVSYNDAVEEALCFGWIDSTARSLDDEHSIQRFTPRRAKSSFSQPNIERLIWLSKEKLIHPDILPGVQHLIESEYKFPKDIIAAIKKNREAWANYQNFKASYQRLRVAYIDSARNRPEDYEKRLQNFIKKTAEGKIIKGYGGIDKYY
ncbi:MAG TPA: YdeI/OmpD-associated family protein [Bacteroidales bacterium]|nr:YdeI/OmpD-associated family protein [Bacteroidales bacterium]HRX96726.1 YdeI/OmpD-associated family protein [Bacteroidales bacterium]